MIEEQETLALYRTWPTPDLVVLRHAFTMDLREARNDETRAFCQGRLQILDIIFKEREEAGNG